ncbi:plastocyanin [Mergibacter septicus]|uniref:OmpA family protein n=1 Tax=Mergibacter septicus TaxID=221402 RepID=UPI0011797D41|nr:OmpA family protein [Mergibacter septicus]AWX13536.1 plastocyanin [Mergibacter septicus]
MKLFKKALIPLTILTLTACGNLSHITSAGTTTNPVWPKVTDSRVEGGGGYGIWPNWNNIHQLEQGMSKDQISHLIGVPNFNEGLFGVREWDYVFNYRKDGEHQICQFKILFNDKVQAASFLWKPAGCGYHYEIDNDFLFNFDSAEISEKGEEKLSQIAFDLTSLRFKAIDPKHIKIEGYTDRLGSDEYNNKLSAQRANNVKDFLIKQGVPADKIIAVGLGKDHQIKACQNETGEELRECLRPNRRVVISVE